MLFRALSQKNLLFGLIKSRKGFMMSLMEYAQATWLMRPNHERALVRSCGGEGVIASGVILYPIKVITSWQNLNFLALATISFSAHSVRKSQVW